MGYYRYIISVLVLLSHTGLYFLGVNQGIVSVISFLLITGYTTELSLERMDVANIKSIGGFLGKRFIRIFPQYWFYVLFTFAIVFGFGLWHETVSDISLKSVIGNMLLLPLNYSYLSNVISDPLAYCLAIPAAWTLGLQFTWWVIAPMIKRCRKTEIGKKFIYIVAFISVTVFISSIIGITSGMYSYSNIVGMLWVFLLGILINENRYKFLGAVWTIDLFLIAYLSYHDELINGQNNAVCIGLLVGIPMVTLVKNFPRTKLDGFFGNISYGVYLNHFTVKEILVNVMNREPRGFFEWGILVLISTLLASLVCFVEKRITLIYRNRLSRKNSC